MTVPCCRSTGERTLRGETSMMVRALASGAASGVPRLADARTPPGSPPGRWVRTRAPARPPRAPPWQHIASLGEVILQTEHRAECIDGQELGAEHAGEARAGRDHL